MDVYLIRHGQSQANLQQIMQGHLNSPLSELGEKQANSLISKLPNFDKVYSSPLKRALTTAQISTSSTVITKDGLKELNLGKLEGQQFADYNWDRENLNNYLFLDNNTYHTKIKSESNTDFISRVILAFNEIIQESNELSLQKVAVYSHGGTMRVILQKYLGLMTREEAYFTNAEVILLKYNNSKSFNFIYRKSD